MYDYPSVSVIIPAYNAQTTISNCLKSIKETNYPSSKIEIIVVDNGSTDATAEIAGQYASTILIEPNVNVGGLRNIGASNSTGEILAFTDSDCLVSRDWLKAAVDLLSENKSMRGLKENLPPVGIATGRIGIPNDATWVIKAWALNRGKKQQVTKKVVWASAMNMVMWRDLFFQVNGFSNTLVTCEDVELSEKVINTDHVILYSEGVEVIHLGEAKNITQLFKKEYWRGSGAAPLLKKGGGTVRDWRYLFQIILFSSCFVAGLFNVLFLNQIYAFSFLGGHLLLPFLRSIFISLKNHSAKSIGKIFCVWYVYYCARSASFWRFLLGS